VAQSGTIYIADPTNNRIVVEPAGGGAQSNLTFTGVTPATLSGPMGVAVDSAANVYISDTGNNRILKVNPLTGVATVLGNYVWIPGASCDAAAPTSPTCPAGGLSKEAASSIPAPTTAPPQYVFNHPQGLAVDASNNVYVADTGNSAVVEIPSNIALGGAVPLLNYPGAPKFVNPVAVAVDTQGNVYVADTKVAGAVIVELPPGGGDLVNVPGPQFQNTKSAGLASPNGVAVDAAGDVYVSDSVKNVVVEIPSASGQNPPFNLNFPGLNGPAGIALDASGNVYVADSGNKQVLFDYRQNPTISFGNVPQNLPAPAQPLCANTIISAGFNIGSTGPGCVLKVTNIGSQPLTLTSPITSVVGAGNVAYSLTNTCTSPLPAGLTCTISPTFVPTVDNGQSETVNLNGGPQSLSLTANGAQPLVGIVLSATYTGGTSTTAPTAGATATITATVSQPHISGNTPTGNVVFTYKILGDGTTGTQTVALNGSATASFALPTLLQGRQYTVNATYSGDSLNSSTVATALVLYVPGVPVTVTATSTSFTYGSTPPAITGTVTGITDPAVTYKFTSAATATTPIGVYPVTVVFSGGSSLTYGFPPALTTGGAPATVTEKAAALTYTIPNFTTQYGAADLSYGVNAVVGGAVNGDTFSATFTPPQSSILNVGTYSVVATVTGPNAGNYTVTAPPSTLTVTQAPVAISVTAAQTAVLNTTAGVSSATYQISVSSNVPAGKGVPSGSVTVTDNFIPINATGYGTPSAPATLVVPLVAGFGTFAPFAPATGTAFPSGTATPGIHQYSFAYSGDSNFQTGTLVPSSTAAACVPSAIAVNCLVVDNPDFTLTSPTGPISVLPGVVPSGNGLPAAPNQNSAAQETAVLFVNRILGFVGQVSLSCQTQNPSYVSCFMTPQSVCFAAASTPACTNTATTAATVLGVQTPATLPLGFKFTSQLRTSATGTALAFLPVGLLAFCVRRRRRLSKALWMLMAVAAVSVGMSGCGGNLVSFYTPIPTGPQTVTVTATYLGNGSNQPAATRSFVVPININ
jgi:sugar lactone lactonase YvrE